MSDYKSLKTESYLEKSRNIDKMSSFEIAKIINEEDKTVAYAVEKALDKIAEGIDCIAASLKNNGRIFYAGAGTSGRLGVLDASECPPTYGVTSDRVVGLIAGGKEAAYSSMELAEDDDNSIVSQLKEYNFNKDDICIGISASGSAACVKGAFKYAKEIGASTIAVTNNSNSPLIGLADIIIAAEVGPEVITGSTRMKAGTAQKMIINMLSTGAMIKYGRTRGNYMAYMVPSNIKLVDRAIRMISDKTGCDYETAKAALEKHNKNIAAAIDDIEKD
ncbi:N-acetylmuramic acid 6-phosphate etherase [Eubacteriales bacterium OttesenSCG-928-G02]|nr:N-acetylmuramic acid 6-phosphate etherase [Eubacteriales bacterium OttesenSCG-928-G02]